MSVLLNKVPSPAKSFEHTTRRRPTLQELQLLGAMGVKKAAASNRPPAPRRIAPTDRPPSSDRFLVVLFLLASALVIGSTYWFYRW
jgi:hypothetical protein